jgi:NADH-quinone oxidoreductase subunit C
MNESTKAVAELFSSHLGEKAVFKDIHRGVSTLEVAPENWLEVCRYLRDEAAFSCEQLTDLCGVDYLSYGQSEWETNEATSEGFSRGVDSMGPGRFSWAERPESSEVSHRFAVVIHLLSLKLNKRFRLRCFAPDEGMPIVPSLTDIWSSANWYEREAFDLFGIIFEGHPDLRRLLTDYGFTGHPFRKDFPLIGNVAVRYDEARKRVVYEPVEIEPRVLVPRVLRDDTRYWTDDIDLAAESESEAEAKGKAN